MTGLFPIDRADGTSRTRLLVSVADAAEVDPAIEGGVDILDVKNPAAGAIGRATPGCLTEIVAQVQGRVPVTAAWGELAEALPLGQSEREALRGVRLVKFGTARLKSEPADWSSRWRAIRESLPAKMAMAVVHYADWHCAEALNLEATLAKAEEMQAGALVIDTWAKGEASLLDFYVPAELTEIVQRTRARRMEVVLAGSLRLPHFERVSECGSSVIGVRGAACRDGAREGTICRERVANLKRVLDGFPALRQDALVGDVSLNDSACRY